MQSPDSETLIVDLIIVKPLPVFAHYLRVIFIVPLSKRLSVTLKFSIRSPNLHPSSFDSLINFFESPKRHASPLLYARQDRHNLSLPETCIFQN